MSPHPDTRHQREKEHGGNDFKIACAIIDDARICHVGFTVEEYPYVVPMACARDKDQLLLHGSVASRVMKSLADGLDCCVTITHLDGLVFARSAFHSSMNYRSVMIFGKAQLIEDELEKNRSFDVLVEQLMPGRLAELRDSTPKELKATHLLKLPIEVFTTKVRTGPPDDPKSDLDLPVWAGVVPFGTINGEPVTAPDMRFKTCAPAYLSKM